MDTVLFFVFFTSVIIWLITTYRNWQVKHLRIKIMELAKQLLMVHVEKYSEKNATVFLMYALEDNAFLMQAPTAASLIELAKERFPGKLILVHGDEEILSMPEFQVENTAQTN